MATTPEAKFSIRVDSNAAEVSKRDADALTAFKDAITKSERAVKDYQTSLSKLKGSSDQVKKAKEELKAKIDAEKNAISEANLKILEAGSSLDKLKTRSMAAAKQSDEHRKKTLELADAIGGVLVAAILAVEVAIVAAGAKFALWVLESGNATRSANLLRVAMTGSEEDARRLGNQVDALARKVPTAKAEINALAGDLSRIGLGGQTLVDTLNAATQAQAALGGDAANKVRELVERGKLMGNFSLGPLETQGLGVSFNDVAGALAKNTKTGLADAQQALIEGRVKMADGAAALRTAMEKRFAGVNLAKMLDLDVMKEKFKETLGSLTKDINLEPLLKDVQELFKFFDPTTANGAAVKEVVTMLGTGLIDAVHMSMPFIKGAFEGALGAALDLGITVLEVGLQIEEALGSPKLGKDFDAFETGINAGKYAVIGLAIVLGVLATTLLLALSPLIILAVIVGVIGYAIYKIVDSIDDMQKALWNLGAGIYDKIKAVDWKGIGQEIVNGLASAVSAVSDVGKNIANNLLQGFKDKLGIHSPSKEFERLGEYVTQGFDAGLDKGRGFVNATAQGLGGAAKSGLADGASSAGGASIVVEDGAIRITIEAGGSSRRDLEDPAFLATLTHAARLGLTSAAVPNR